MVIDPILAPDETVAQDDPGDETANRYRFQWTWAAIVCCRLLDDTDDIDEVFCEHHEDVLLKHTDGSFTGHQVKTRAENQPPWKANDAAVLTACARFARLENRFVGRFQRFCFLTNHQLYSSGNGQDLLHVLSVIRNVATPADLPSNINRWIARIAREAKVGETEVFAAMAKTQASGGLPKLRDASMRLITTIAQYWAPAEDCAHAVVVRAAANLIEECGRASSFDHEQLLPAYVVANANGNAEISSRIHGKRMTCARVRNVLEQGRHSKATLGGNPGYCILPGEGSTDLLHQKLDAGGFSIVSRISAEDLRNKADFLGIRWTKQYGESKGLERYNHVRSLVLSDAGRAFDATQTEDKSFGPAMRESLRANFRERRQVGDQLFDATDDHLEGIAFSLTAQCKIAWSHARPWEVK